MQIAARANATARMQWGLGLRQCQIQHRVPFVACSQLFDSAERAFAEGMILHASMKIRKELEANEDSLCRVNGEHETVCVIKHLDPRNLLKDSPRDCVSSVSSLADVVQDGGTVT